MRLARFTLLVAGVFAAQEDAPVAPIVEPAPRAPIGGIGGLALTSVVSGSDAQGLAFEADLSVWFVFPDRVRRQLTPRPARPGARELAYRYGPQTWRVESGSARSRRLAGAEARSAELEFELRRALWLWPGGFEWSGEGGFRSAPVNSPSLGADEHWFLVARLGAEGRPAELGLAEGAPDGDPRALLHARAILWSATGTRSFPAAFDLFHGDALTWHERVEATFVAPQALDHFFLPPDLKRGVLPVADAAPREVRLPERAERRIALSGGEDWAAALESARLLADEERKRLKDGGRELAPGVLVELDLEGRPRAVRIELAELTEDLPQGWVQAPEQAAWDLRIGAPGPVSVHQLLRLRALLSPSDRPDWAFVRVAPDAQGTPRAVLVQPFEPALR